MYISFESLMSLLRGWEADFLEQHIGYLIPMNECTEAVMRSMFYADRLKLTQAVLTYCAERLVGDDDLYACLAEDDDEL